MSAAKALYQQDFYRWTAEQAKRLRDSAGHGVNVPLDWLNLAEEIESLGRSERRELSSRLETIMEHLLKLEVSQAVEPRSGWMATIVRERSGIERLLDDSPSLRREVPSLLQAESARARRAAASALGSHDELLPELRASSHSYAADQVLGDWFPPLDAPQPPS